jgi:hypothetical protein
MSVSGSHCRVWLKSTPDRIGFYRKSWHHNRSLKRASYSVRAGDPSKGDASARIYVGRLRVKEGLLLWVHDPQTPSCRHGTERAG